MCVFTCGLIQTESLAVLRNQLSIGFLILVPGDICACIYGPHNSDHRGFASCCQGDRLPHITNDFIKGLCEDNWKKERGRCCDRKLVDVQTFPEVNETQQPQETDMAAVNC